MITDQEFVLIEDSIIARNTGNVGAAAAVIAPSNCGAILPTHGGGNVESGTDCGLERQNTTGGLATALADDGGQTPTLALPWTSAGARLRGRVHRHRPARRGAAAGRGLRRGAYEAHAAPPPATPTPIDAIADDGPDARRRRPRPLRRRW